MMASERISEVEIARGLALVAAREEAVERWRASMRLPSGYALKDAARAASEPISEWADEHLGAALREMVAMRQVVSAALAMSDEHDYAEARRVFAAAEALCAAGYGEETPSDGG